MMANVAHIRFVFGKLQEIGKFTRMALMAKSMDKIQSMFVT